MNGVETDVEHRHRVVERSADGSFSVVYQAGPKAGLTAHFLAARELRRLITGAGFASVLALRPNVSWRDPAERGVWLQWEGVHVSLGQVCSAA
ncbi:MAG: hypothetical protein ACRDQ5_06905 [Sciscionella sp.]